ncbi:protein-L-isoaspartate(D-aspartate) O-methyltransferase [Candidatus Woesearchaeota archaeon]|nr:protein-L-isoaspartate(D-aspartate) O-methyltransferase [Candidatus Woesearchaeota archaeon]MCF7901542.1 protein-L-isoaspartate(D-aspartate) O-methyltransferase [Candidatus Woesearchaeota archaeon]MCF8013962.1 protein-L-isoaspartate(D-aspartate) O-methyltransferase [Candidatus Woesearchaeota archaeon]
MYEKERESMVEFQLKKRGIENPYVLEVMRMVPRHEFIPEVSKPMAYGDFAVPIGQGQTASQPYIVAKMIELLEPRRTDKVLEIGSGLGYAAAVLSKLSGKVIGIERIPEFAQKANKNLSMTGSKNARIIVGDGSIGAIHYYPFDRVLISTACPEIPEDIIQQTRNNGIIVAPVGDRMKQKLIRARKTPQGLKIEEHGTVAFVPMLGKKGFQL